MKTLNRSLAAAFILTGAVLCAPAQAMPTCATAIGMTITPPAGTAQSPDTGACLDITGGYNWAYSGYSDAEKLAFRQLLAAAWGGSADDWVYLNEIDGRSDSISDGLFPPDRFDSFDVWTNGQVGSGAGAGGTFSVSIIAEPTLQTPFEAKRMDIVGVMKPNEAANPGNNSQRGTFVDSVLAYLFSGVEITQRGEMTGTFDFRSSTTAPADYLYSGLGFFGRVAATVNPTPVPEPGVLALLGVAALGASVALRKRGA